MKTFSGLLLFFFIAASASNCFSQANQLQWEWAKSAGDYWSERGTKLRTDNNGNVYVSMYYMNPVDIEGDTVGDLLYSYYHGFCLIKYDRFGKKIWIKDFSCLKSVDITGLEVDANENVYVTGIFQDTMYVDNKKLVGITHNDWQSFIMKADRKGTIQWITNFGNGGDDMIRDFSLNSAGNLVIVGDFYGMARNYGGFSITSFESGQNMFFMEVSNAGKILWVKNTRRGYVDPGDLALDRNDNIYITGSFADPMSLDGVNYITTSDIDNQDIFLLKTDKAGNFQWIKQAGTDRPDAGRSLTCDTQGNCILAGKFGGGINRKTMALDSQHVLVKNLASSNTYFIAKYDGKGQVQWGFKYDALDGSAEYPFFVKSDDDGNFYLSGSFDGAWYGDTLTDTIVYSGSLYHDLCIQQFDKDGKKGQTILAGNETYGSNESVGDFSRDRMGNFYVTGSHGGYDSLRLGKIIIRNPDIYSDFFIAKLSLQDKVRADSTFIGPVCAGDKLKIPFYLYDTVFKTGNSFELQLSDKQGLFGNPLTIAFQLGTKADTFVATLPLNLAGGSGYRLRVKASNPPYISYDNHNDIAIDAAPAKPTISRNAGLLSCNATATNYQWLLNDTLIQGATQKTYQATKSGRYTVRIFNANGCSNVSDPVSYSTGLNDVKAQAAFDVNVYPNPVSYRLSFDFPKGSKVTCMDMTGRYIMLDPDKLIATGCLDVSCWSAGVYTFLFNLHGAIVSRKVVIKHGE